MAPSTQYYIILLFVLWRGVRKQVVCRGVVCWQTDAIKSRSPGPRAFVRKRFRMKIINNTWCRAWNRHDRKAISYSIRWRVRTANNNNFLRRKQKQNRCNMKIIKIKENPRATAYYHCARVAPYFMSRLNGRIHARGPLVREWDCYT